MSDEITPDCKAIVRRTEDSFIVEIYNNSSEMVKRETLPSQITGFSVRFGESNEVWFGVNPNPNE